MLRKKLLCATVLLIVVVDAAWSSSVTIDFDHLPDGSPTGWGLIADDYAQWGVHFRSIGVSDMPKYYSMYHDSKYAITLGCSYPPGHNIVADFDTPVYGISVKVSSAAGVTITMVAKDPDGSVIDCVVSPPMPAAYTFVGPIELNTDVPIASVEWWPSNDRAMVGLDDMRITVAQDASVTVRGRVCGNYYPNRTVSRVPLQGATVTANGEETKTDSLGEFEIRGVTPGQIEINASKDGYYIETQFLPYTPEDHCPYSSWHCEDLQTLSNIEFFLVPDDATIIDSGFGVRPPFRPITHGFHFMNKTPGYCLGMSYASWNYWWYRILPLPKADSTDRYGWPTETDYQVKVIESLETEYQVSDSFHTTALELFGSLGKDHYDINYDTLRVNLNRGIPMVLMLGRLWTCYGFLPCWQHHNVVAYKLVETPTHRYIWIYDNNKPESEEAIELVKVGEHWQMAKKYDNSWEAFTVQGNHKKTYSYLTAIHSPASLQLTDPDGLILHKGDSEIDGGYYRVLDLDEDGDQEEVAVILWPKEGQYLVNVVPDSNAEPNETYTLEEYKFGKKTVLADNVEIQDIPNGPYVSVALIAATVDIESDSVGCDDQYITVFIELPDNYIPAEIDANTVCLHTYNAPFSVLVESLPREIGDHDSDGIQDLMVEFDRGSLIAALEEPNEGQVLELGLAGYLWDGTRLEGSDVVTLTLVDNTAPEFNLSVIPDTLWPPNHKMVQITPNWTARDLCDIHPNVSLVSIVMNEGDETNTYDPSFDDTVGDGHTTADIQIVDGDIYLRAERSGKGVGRIYTITYQATDDSGNVAVASATVTVPHDQP